LRARRRAEWRFGSRRLSAGDHTLVAGEIALAPEAREGSRDPLDADRAFAIAVEMEEAGADLILIAPDAWMAGVKLAGAAEELRRLVPVLKRLRDRLEIPTGVTTAESAVALRAFELGVEAIFDPTGLTRDPALAKAVVDHDAGLILGHARGNPESWLKLPPWKEPLPGLLADLDASLNRARRAGVKPESLAADPGLGYGKRREQHVEIVSGLGQLDRLGVPLAIGLADLPASAAGLIAHLGAHLIRTSQVAAVKEAVAFADAVQLSAALREERADSADSSVSRGPRPPAAQSPFRSEGRELRPFRKPGDSAGSGPPGPRGPRNPKWSNRPPRPPR
jgi:dihydropteroate synthase